MAKSKMNDRQEKVNASVAHTLENRKLRILRHLKTHPDDNQAAEAFGAKHTARAKPRRNSATVIRDIPGYFGGNPHSSLVLSDMKNRLNSASKQYLQFRKLFKAMTNREENGLPPENKENLDRYQKALYAW